MEPLAARSEAVLKEPAGTAKARDPYLLLRKRLAAAKWRCEHATGPNRSYAGIAFEFSSPAAGARLLLDKLGPIPPRMSLDRIDPYGPYSIDNLRYATPLLQVLNRRRKSSVSHWTKNHG